VSGILSHSEEKDFRFPTVHLRRRKKKIPSNLVFSIHPSSSGRNRKGEGRPLPLRGSRETHRGSERASADRTEEARALGDEAVGNKMIDLFKAEWVSSVCVQVSRNGRTDQVWV